MAQTQDHLSIDDIKYDIALLKGGGAALVLQTTAVNFDLLSEMEQVSIISAFGQTLNSLSFAIQIVIRSKRLDITSYLHLLDKAATNQTSPLLSGVMRKYRLFVQSLIKQNEVLEKHFFIVIPISKLELGFLSNNKEETFKKAVTQLLPRKEQVVRQLARVGLKATQLSSKALIELFYDIYNPPVDQPVLPMPITPVTEVLAPSPIRKPGVSTPQPIRRAPVQNPAPSEIGFATRPARSHPFVVEELMDSP